MACFPERCGTRGRLHLAAKLSHPQSTLSYPRHICHTRAMTPRPIRSSPARPANLMFFLNSTFFYPVKCVKLFSFHPALLNKPVLRQ